MALTLVNDNIKTIPYGVAILTPHPKVNLPSNEETEKQGLPVEKADGKYVERVFVEPSMKKVYDDDGKPIVGADNKPVMQNEGFNKVTIEFYCKLNPTNLVLTPEQELDRTSYLDNLKDTWYKIQVVLKDNKKVATREGSKTKFINTSGDTHWALTEKDIPIVEPDKFDFCKGGMRNLEGVRPLYYGETELNGLLSIMYTGIKGICFTEAEMKLILKGNVTPINSMLKKLSDIYKNANKVYKGFLGILTVSIVSKTITENDKPKTIKYPVSRLAKRAFNTEEYFLGMNNNQSIEYLLKRIEKYNDNDYNKSFKIELGWFNNVAKGLHIYNNELKEDNPLQNTTTKDDPYSPDSEEESPF